MVGDNPGGRVGLAVHHAGARQIGDARDRRVEDLLVRGRLDLDLQHQSHRPARVVIGAQRLVRERLLLQQGLDESAVRLVALDHVRPGRERAVRQRDLAAGLRHLDALQLQQRQEQIDARQVLLAGRHDVRVRRLLLSGLQAVAALAVEVLDQDVGERRCVLQRGEHGGLHVVGVVAHRPRHFLVRRQRPIPFAAGLASALGWCDLALHRRGAAVAERLVHPDQAVVIRRHEGEIARRPHVHEAVRPHAGHAVLGELHHLEVGKRRQFAVHDRIEIGILWRLPGERVEERHRFVQVVHHRRMRLQVPRQVRTHRHLRVVDVAVVVVKDVLAPVRRSRDPVLLLGDVHHVLAVPVDVAIATVGVAGGREADDDAIADLADERCLARHQAVRQFHQHLRRPGLRAVQARHQVVHRRSDRDQPLRFVLRQPARVGQAPEIRGMGGEILQRRFIGDVDDGDVSSLVGLADGGHADPW